MQTIKEIIREVFDDTATSFEHIHAEALRRYNEQPDVLVKLDAITDDDVPIVHLFTAARRLRERASGDVFATKTPFDGDIGGGVQGGDLVIISGPTANGKTTLAQTWTAQWAAMGIPVQWFSYEVPTNHLADTFMRMGVHSDLPLYCPFEHTSGNLDWVEKKILEATKLGVQIVVIDHLGFLLPKLNRDKVMREVSTNYSVYLGDMCRTLKQLAIKQQIIIVLMAHTRKTDEPRLHDIAHSGAIAQEADVVFMVNREADPAFEHSGTLYTLYTRIALEKNRRTGISSVHWFHLVDGLLVADITYHGLPKPKRRQKDW